MFFSPKKQKNRADICSDIGCALLLQDVFSRILGQKDGEKIFGDLFLISEFSLKFPLRPSTKVINGLSAPIRTWMDCWNVPARITSGQ